MESDPAAMQMSHGRWQTYFMPISYCNKKKAIWPEVCRLSDTLTEKLIDAYGRKLKAYKPIQPTLQKYTVPRWTVRVLPWVLGARGLVHVHVLKLWLSCLELSFSSSLKKRTYNTHDPQSSLEMHGADQRCSRKRKAIFGEKSLIST